MMIDHKKTKEEILLEIAGLYRQLSRMEQAEPTDNNPESDGLPDMVLPFLKGPSALFKEAIDTFILIGDAEGRIVYFNDVAEQISGYRADEVLGRVGWDIFIEPQEARHLKELVSNNEVDHDRKEHIWVAKDGSRKYVKWLSYADIDGGMYHIIKGIDVSEHWNTLASLAESRERYRMLFESMSEGFGVFEFVYGDQGQLIDAMVIETNPALVNMFNARSDLVINRSIRELFPTVTPDDFVRFTYAVQNGYPLQFINITAPRHKWFEIKAYPLHKANQYALIIRDVSELKLMLERLSASEERFYKAFHNSPEMMTIVRMSDDVFLEANQQFLENFEYSRQEIAEIKPADLLSSGQEELYNKVISDLNERITLKNVELQFATKTGRVLTAICSFQVITLNDQSCRLVVLKDITKEKQLEKELMRLDRLHLVGEMAASIGHEIRNPMTSVRGFLQMMSMEDSKPEKQEYYALMIEEIDRANAIITEFLSMARGKAVVLEPKNLNSIVQAIYPMIKAESLMNNKEVRLDIRKLPPLMLDEKEIRQLVLNLARNGLEAMEAGGTVVIGSRAEESDCILYFQDEGEGFAPEMISKAGTPFTSNKDNGIGLGLAVCYSIAERHNARIEIDTGYQGTTVSVRFPHIAGE